MSANKLTIRRQIRSIGNTKKMTKAMELVSASKMRRAVAAAQSSRPYANTASDILSYLAPLADPKSHPLLVVRPIKKVGIVLVSTNRGLCGGFNNSLLSHLNRVREQAKRDGAKSIELYTLGRRARDAAARAGYALAADFEKSDMTRSAAGIIPLIHTITEKYRIGELDSVILVSMHFVSTVKQSVRIAHLLPFSSELLNGSGENGSVSKCVFEPSESFVVDYAIPRLLEARVYQAVLESEASEHSARMMAMHNASEAATDMLFDLQLTYNQARQASITQEIAEISSGRAALE